MQQNAAADAMAMRQFEAKMRFDQEKQAFDQQIENAKLAETERYRGVNDQRARQEFDAKMAFSNAQLGSLNEDRARRGDEFTRGLKQEEELKKKELAAKSEAAAKKEIRATIIRNLNAKKADYNRVFRSLQDRSTISNQAGGKQHLASLEKDIAEYQSALDSDQLEVPQATTDSAALSKWFGEVSSAEAQMAADEKAKIEKDKQAKVDETKIKDRLSIYDKAARTNPVGALAALENDPDIPPEKREWFSETIKLINPVAGELIALKNNAFGSAAPIQQLDLAIANRQKYLLTPINQINTRIKALQNEGDTGSGELAALQKQWDDWKTMDDLAATIDPKNKQGATQTIIERLKAQKEAWLKDPQMIAKERQFTGQAAFDAERKRVMAANAADAPVRQEQAAANDMNVAYPWGAQEEVDPIASPLINRANRAMDKFAATYTRRGAKILEVQQQALWKRLMEEGLRQGLSPEQAARKAAVRVQQLRANATNNPNMELGPAGIESERRILGG